MSLPADRNLLYGILAFQLGFIDRETLVSALDQWTSDKSRPLSEILIEQGVLTKNVQELLDSLVEEHLKQHDGLAEKSLAAVSSIGSIRDEIEQFGDVDLNATLGHVPADTTIPGHSGSFSVGAVGQDSGGRFRVVRVHAKGGLGQVSVAVDEELSREVALKELQTQFADDEHNRARFSMEAEITGALEHPGIVPVYGAGHYADGRPYYAMRFVRGDSLHDAIKIFHERLEQGDPDTEYELELRKLLQRFIDVCDAIEYAHSRGVLHRDLKPGNIMLGRYGETLVVDWGLAKALGRREPKGEMPPVEEKTLLPPSASGSAPTQMGSAIGTPHYMSPEQAAGKVDELGPSSDVYSLGATLFCLLTGRSPFSGRDVGEILASVQLGIFKAPRKLHSRIAKPLEAICLKAMARESGDRYESPRAMAEDIERWLADQRVKAYREPLLVQMSRWLRKNKVVAGAGLSALAVAFVAALLIAGVLADSNQKLADKEAAAVAARDEAIEARNEATALSEKNRLLALDSQRQVAATYRQQALRSLEEGDTTMALPMLVKSMERLPVEDTREREVAMRNLSAWSQNLMSLKKIELAPLTDFEVVEDSEFLLSQRYSVADTLEAAVAEGPAFEDRVYFQLLDRKSLQQISTELGPSHDYVEFAHDVEKGVACVFIFKETKEADLAEIENLPEDLVLTDENRDRLVVFYEQAEIRRFNLSDGSPLGKPLDIKAYGFYIEPENPEAPPEENEEESFGDVYVGYNIDANISVLQNSITRELEVWSLETAARIDVDLPYGETKIGLGGILAIQVDEKTIRFYNPKTGKEPVLPLVHDSPVKAFEFNDKEDWIVTLTEDGKLHAWTVSGIFSKADAVSDEVVAGSIDSLGMSGSKILTKTKEGVLQLWSASMRTRKVELLRTFGDEEEDDQYYGAYFLANKGSQVIVEMGNTVKLWNPIRELTKDQAMPSSIPAEVFSLTSKDVHGIKWDVDGKYSATYCNEELTLWRLDWKSDRKIDHPDRVVDLKLSKELQILVTVDSKGVIRLWDYYGQLLCSSANAVDGRRRRLLSLEEEESAFRLLVLEQSIYEGDFFPEDQQLQIWEAPKKSLFADVQALRGKFLEVGMSNEKIYVSNRLFDVSTDGSTAVQYVPGYQVYSGDNKGKLVNGSLMVLDRPFTDGVVRHAFDVPFKGYSYNPVLRISEKGETVALARRLDDQEEYKEYVEIQLWSCKENKAVGPVINVDHPYSPVWQENQVTFSTGQGLVIDFDSQVRKCVVGTELKESYSNSGSVDRELSLSIWDLETGKPVGKPLLHSDTVQCVEFSPDGKVIATGSQDGYVRIWDAETGERIGEPLPHNDSVKILKFLPDGKGLITVTNGRVWRTWNLVTSKTLVAPLSLPHEGGVVLGISPDGTSLFTGGNAGNVQVWDVQSSIPIGPPVKLSGSIGAIIVRDRYVAVNTFNSWRLFPRSLPKTTTLDTTRLRMRSLTGAELEDSGLLRHLAPQELSELNSALEDEPEELPEEIKMPEVITLPENKAPSAMLHEDWYDTYCIGRN